MPRLLGIAGVLPALAGFGMAWLGHDDLAMAAMLGALVYAALIFSFLGGTWWGMAAAAPAAEGRGTLGWVWVAAVLPSLLAAAVLVTVMLPGSAPLSLALLILGIAILISPMVDAILARRSGPAIAPPWWLSLRIPLSFALGTVTIATGVLAGI